MVTVFHPTRTEYAESPACEIHSSLWSSSSSSEHPPITVTSEGGITGRGVGGLVIDGAQVTATLGQRSCNGTLTADEQKRMQALMPVRDSDPSGHGSPDQIRYTLSAGDHKVSWFGENAPADVAPLFKLLWQIRQRVLAAC